MKSIILAVLLTFSFYGCGYPNFAAKTAVHVQTLPDGSCTADYTSDKEENDLNASVCGGTVSVKKAGAQPEALSAMMQFQSNMLMMYQKLADQINVLTQTAIKAGALTGGS